MISLIHNMLNRLVYACVRVHILYIHLIYLRARFHVYTHTYKNYKCILLRIRTHVYIYIYRKKIYFIIIIDFKMFIAKKFYTSISLSISFRQISLYTIFLPLKFMYSYNIFILFLLFVELWANLT